jgi:hypothetical protein
MGWTRKRSVEERKVVATKVQTTGLSVLGCCMARVILDYFAGRNYVVVGRYLRADTQKPVFQAVVRCRTRTLGGSPLNSDSAVQV